MAQKSYMRSKRKAQVVKVTEGDLQTIVDMSLLLYKHVKDFLANPTDDMRHRLQDAAHHQRELFIMLLPGFAESPFDQ